MAYKPNDILTVTQLAAAKGVHGASIRRAVVRGDLTAFHKKPAYLFYWRDVAAWEPSNRGRKRRSAPG